MYLRGVRGATVSIDNTKEAIIESTKELLTTIINQNNIKI